MSGVWDVAIAGGGATGLTLALALRALSGGGLRVVLIDRADPALRTGPRTSALAEGPRRMLEKLDVWDKLQAGAQAITRMEISDSEVTDAIKPALVSFQSDRDGAALAHMLFHRDLEPALLSAALQRGVQVVADAVDDIDLSGATARLRMQSGSDIRARLLVGADGLRSRVRRAAGIPVVSWSYERTALVMTIAHEFGHDGVAIQHFLEGGPFASLPLCGNRSSIVWSEPTSKAATYLNEPTRVLVRELEERLGGRFGDLQIEDEPQGFPLIFQLARRFVAPRLALVGDAAHRVHPLAGQGLNLGLRDVATLAELVIEQAALGLDPGSEDVLRRYEQRRRFDATASAAAFDVIHKTYSVSSHSAVGLARRIGMSAVDRATGLKYALSREAGGLLGDAPLLFR